MTSRIGILMSHPTQYHTPWFRALAQRPEIRIKVFYCFQPDADSQGDGFDVSFEWDVPTLEGYPHGFLKNVARRPGFHFAGCDTPEIAKLVASDQFDAWLINGWRVKSEWQAIRACWKHKAPMMIRGDSHLLDHRSSQTRIAKRMILGRWIPRFDAYLTVGKLNEDYYKFYGADSSRFFPVRHFVDNEWFAARTAEVSNEEERRHWRIPTSSNVFLFAGKFIDKKQPLLAIKAIEKVASRTPGAHLLMVGDGALRKSCEEYCASRQLPVTFAGFLNQSQIAKAYACADVLVLPSAYAETWGLVVNEAMACGVPAIVSDRVGCAPDLVRPNQTGAVFPAGDVDALAEAMSQYLEKPELINAHGNKARNLIHHYSVEEATDHTVSAALSLTEAKAAACAV
ncbi:MAG: glycosyltransferase family 4 protein [Acidobacteriota bacterium]